MCKFNEESCNPSCNKYAICSFFELERQIEEISTQLNLLLKTVNSLSGITISNEDSIKELQSGLDNYTKDMLDLISELRNKEK